MNLETLYNEYKNYTGDNAVFYNSNFSRKLNDTFSDYGLEQYMSLISTQEKESYSKDSAYTFTEKDIEKLGYFLGSATSRHSTRPGKYHSLSVLNPFLHPLIREKMGISDLDEFTNLYIENGKTIFDLPASFTYPKIKILIWFAKQLKNCIKRLIIASFYMKTFNGNTLNRIISKLNDFVDELYLIEEINDFSEPNRVYCGGPEDEDDFYHSIDVLAAADTCDYIYYSRSDNPDNYLPLVNLTNIASTFIMPERSYRSKLQETISNLYKNYVKLLSEGYEDVEICERHSKELGIDLSVNSIETMIFKEYIFFEGQNVFNGIIEMDKAIKKTQEWVIKMISDAEEKANEKSTESAKIDDALDKLLFKPFIKFHDDDMERLKEKIKNNSHVLPEKKEKEEKKSSSKKK